MTTNLLKNRAIIHPAREGDLVLHGNAWGRGFTIRDADDRCVAGTGAGKASAGVASPDDVVRVEIPDALRLAEMISVVQIWRTAKKSAIASSTAVSSTVARGV